MMLLKYDAFFGFWRLFPHSIGNCCTFSTTLVKKKTKTEIWTYIKISYFILHKILDHSCFLFLIFNSSTDTTMLSLEEIRKQNINRNRSFLKGLGFDQSPKKTTQKKKKSRLRTSPGKSII